MTYEIALITIGAAILAGVAWNTLGIWQRWREGADDSSPDWSKVKKNVIIGTILGVIAYGVAVSQGSSLPIIVDVNTFALAVIAFFPLVVVADKIFTRKRTDE